MNREQALDSYYCIKAGSDGVALVNDIYDKLDSQTCSNCLFGHKPYCDNPDSFCEATRIEPTNGCNNFIKDD